jgi:lysophospholipase L1-like esterase
MIKKIKTSLIFLLFFNFAWAQDTLAPFWKDIQTFKIHDSSSFPPKHAILFTGSSSFTMWVDVQEYFPGHTIINRGFGGSSLRDVIRYANDIIFPYQPRQIIIYCGENDIAGDDSITAKIVFNRFKKLFQLIRSRMPGGHFAYVSMKPSPSRKKFLPKIVEANLLIKNYLKTKQRTAFIDVYHKMFNKDGTIMKDIFIADELHMNAKGYAIWQKIIEPHLLR